VSSGNHTGYPRVDIHHDSHGEEERAHGGEDHVARVLVVAAHATLVVVWLVPKVPILMLERDTKERKIGKINQKKK
jgi:hypothetical protein